MSKKAKPINFIISLEVYPFDVMVSIGQTDKQLAESLKPYDNGRMTERDYELCKYTSDTCLGRAAMFSTNSSILRTRQIPKTANDFGNMAHEVFHVVTFVMHQIGMKLVVMKSDEAYAYLIGYLTENIYKELNKYY